MGRGAIRRIEIGGEAEVEVGYALAFDASRRVLEKVGFRYERDLVHHGRDQVLYRRKGAP